MTVEEAKDRVWRFFQQAVNEEGFPVFDVYVNKKEDGTFLLLNHYYADDVRIPIDLLREGEDT